MERPVVHIVGAGLAGLAAAVRLSRSPCVIVVHEASPVAGGRCRSFFDPTMGATIDNGNHLLLTGNRAALAYVDAIGARGELAGPGRCEIAFADMASGERWTLRVNEGRLPWWLLSKDRRPPRTRMSEAFGALRLFLT
ncbi:MAG TPA: FAD-dependent oxidoreductase, partial [Roseiarcus sp.]|nr:FAD-dependent oxidoreductase [Roseiarcus sp.]